MAIKKQIVIGVTGPAKGGFLPWIMTWFAIKRAGAKAIRMTVTTDTEWERLDGLVLGGGSDIDPKNYGEEFLRLSDRGIDQSFMNQFWSIFLFLLRLIFSVKMAQPKKDFDRDDMEKKLFLYVINKRVPVLGICRGAQLMNIALGGTLYQNTGNFYTETPHINTILPKKRVYLFADSRLREILGVDTCRVNSLHDQAIKDLGTDIIITGKDKNQIVQAIENRKYPFVIGVQWHPEYLPQIKKQQRLFKALVAAAQR